jgi:hypothetical protein
MVSSAKVSMEYAGGVSGTAGLERPQPRNDMDFWRW